MKLISSKRVSDSCSDNRKSKIQNPKWATVLAVVFTLAIGRAAALAQQPTKIPRIGYISETGNQTNQGPYVAALRQGLRELGYIEGKNFTIEYRGAEGQPDRIPSLTIELIERQVNVLIVATLPAILAAKQATKTTPIIMVATLDPVANKLVDSLARPGGNLTGISTLAQDLNGKRLELLMEVVPRLSRVAVLRDADSQFATLQFKEYEAAARVLKIELQSIDVRGPNPDLEKRASGCNQRTE